VLRLVLVVDAVTRRAVELVCDCNCHQRLCDSASTQ
jgi:hypothetical protein